MNRRLKLAAVAVVLLLVLLLLGVNLLPGPGSATTPPTIAAAFPTTAVATTSVATTLVATTPDTPYTVDMSPMGKVTFKHVPQRIVTLDANYNDMLVAVRHNHGLIASGYANNQFDGYYKEVPAVDASFPGDLKFFISRQRIAVRQRDVVQPARGHSPHRSSAAVAQPRVVEAGRGRNCRQRRAVLRQSIQPDE